MRAAVVVIIVAATACGSFGAASDPPPDAGSPDAPAVAQVDAALSDADAATDLGCGWPPFTDDFQRADVAGSWSFGPDYGEGIVLGLAEAPSPRGQSLFADITLSDAATGRQRTLHRSLTPPLPAPSCIELAFSIYVEKFEGPESAVASLELSDVHVISVWLAVGRLYVAEQSVDGNQFEELGGTSMATGSWHGVSVRYGYGASRSLAFSVDSVILAPNPPQFASGAPIEARVGPGFTRVQTAAKFWIDDVVIH